MSSLSRFRILLAVSLLIAAGPAAAQGGFAPYGTATVRTERYAPQKIVLEIAEKAPEKILRSLQVSDEIQRSAPAGSDIKLVILGPAVRVFAKKDYEKYQGIVDQAAALRDAGVQIEFCHNAIHANGLTARDMPGIGVVVPAGYIEIADLVHKGYALLRP